MSQYNENIDYIFRDNLWGIRKTPSDDVWKNISESLDKKEKTKFFPLFLKYAAGVTILIALGFGAFKIMNKNSFDQQMAQEQLTTMNELDNLQSEIPVKNEETTPTQNEQFFSKPLERYVNKNVSYIAEEQDITEQHSSDLTAFEEEDIIKTKNAEVLVMRNAVIHYSGNDFPEINLQQKLDNIKKEEYFEDLLADYYSDYDQKVKKKSNTGWSVGGQIAPLYSHRTVSSDYYTKSVENEYKNAETGILAYAGGINVKIATGKRLSFQSGVYYSKTGQDVNEWTTAATSYSDQGLYANDLEFMSSQGRIDDKGVLNNLANIQGRQNDNLNYNGSFIEPIIQEFDISASQRLEYIEIPLYIRYKIIDRKIGFNVLGGINTNFLIGSENIMYIDGVDQTPLEQYNELSLGETQNIVNVNYSGAFGVGIEYPFIDKLLFSIEPIFRYSFISVNEDIRFNSYPYSFGVFTGLSYKF